MIEHAEFRVEQKKRKKNTSLRVIAIGMLGFLQTLTGSPIIPVDSAYADNPVSIETTIIGEKDDGRPMYGPKTGNATGIREELLKLLGENAAESTVTSSGEGLDRVGTKDVAVDTKIVPEEILEEGEMSFNESLDFFKRTQAFVDSLPQEEIPLTKETLNEYSDKIEHWYVDKGYLNAAEFEARDIRVKILLKQIEENGLTLCARNPEGTVYTFVNSEMGDSDQENLTGKGVWRQTNVHEQSHGVLRLCPIYAKDGEASRDAVELATDTVAYEILAAEANSMENLDSPEARAARYTAASSLNYLAYRNLMYRAYKSGKVMDLLDYLRTQKPSGYKEKELALLSIGLYDAKREERVNMEGRYSNGLLSNINVAIKNKQSSIPGLKYNSQTGVLDETELPIDDLLLFMQKNNLLLVERSEDSLSYAR